MSTRSAPRSSFPEAASHPQCYGNQGGACARDRSCPLWEGGVQTSSWTSPEMNHLSKKAVPMSAVGSKNSSCTHANESSFCSLCFLLDRQQRGHRDCCFSIWGIKPAALPYLQYRDCEFLEAGTTFPEHLPRKGCILSNSQDICSHMNINATPQHAPSHSCQGCNSQHTSHQEIFLRGAPKP